MTEGNSIENWAYLIRNNEDYNSRYFQYALEDLIELREPQLNAQDAAVYGENNFYSFGNQYTGASFHNFTASASSSDYDNVDDTWFENLDWESAVNGFIYYTQEELGEDVFGLTNDYDVEKPSANKGIRRFADGTLDFGGFLALKEGHEGTGATFPAGK